MCKMNINMMSISRYIIVIIALGIASFCNAQDQVVYNNYISNQGILNPAYNGTRDNISGLVIFRKQWIGFDGAPFTGALNVHSPIDAVQNLGLGVVVENDHIGFTNNLAVNVAGSYRLKLAHGMTLALGLQLGFKNVVYDGTKAVIVDYGDPVFEGRISKFGFNFGTGGYLYTDKYFVGLSIPKFFSNKYDTDKQEIRNIVRFKDVHTYIYGGYIFDVDDILIKPTGLVRIVPGAPLTLDVSCSFKPMKDYDLWVGLSYRTVSELVFMAEYRIDRKWTIKYSFDYSISDIQTYAKAGSHEIGLQFDFSPKRRPGIRSMRYF